jgi:uncharacterized repeat protein (TIGR01451 family)
MKMWFGVLLATGVAISTPAYASGVAPGTLISNTAMVDYTIGGNTYSNASNVNTITVDELIDVTVTWQNGAPVQVTPGAADQGLLFRVTNTGNGTETFTLSDNVAVHNDDFNPSNARIYFDSDSSGDFSVGDVLYVPGSNDPTLVSGASVDVLIVSDIPGSVTDGQQAYARLNAASNTFTGKPGDTKPGAGDAGSLAVLGLSGGKASDKGTYQVGNSPFTFTKSAKVTDPKGGHEPVAGAVIAYTLKVSPTGVSAVNSALVTDAIPANTTYVPGSLTLNGTAMGDGTGDGDPGDFNVTTPGSITVDLGALAANASPQLISFQVKIN